MVWVNTSPLVKTYTLEEFWELPEPPGGNDHCGYQDLRGLTGPNSQSDERQSLMRRHLSHATMPTFRLRVYQNVTKHRRDNNRAANYRPVRRPFTQ
jgi:hypothetical protein